MRPCVNLCVYNALLVIAAFTATAEPIAWIGGVTSTSFTIHIDVPSQIDQVVLASDSDFTNIRQTRSPQNRTQAFLEGDYGNLRRFFFSTLQPATRFYLGFREEGRGIDLVASVRTFPQENFNTNITIALGSCQFRTGQDDAFEDIREEFDRVESRENPGTFFMLHMGDMVYADIEKNDIDLYEQALREVLERERVRNVFSMMPVVYMYDDHDYGANDAGFDSPSREAALQNYRTMVPGYALPSKEASYHAFTVGKVRVIMSDVRALSGKDAGSTLGLEQREWLVNELQGAARYSLVIWMMGKPWIGQSEEGVDGWRGFPDERRFISNTMAELGVTNLIGVAGDAHMLAADNGTYTDYSDGDNAAGFPVFQAAPLSGLGSSKGGPYSEGCFAYRRFNNKQYGILHITNLGDTTNGPCVEFIGYDVGKRDEPELRFRKCGKMGGVEGSGGQEDQCDISTFPTWVAVLVVIAAGLSILLIVFVVIAIRLTVKRKKGAQVENGETVPNTEAEEAKNGEGTVDGTIDGTINGTIDGTKNTETES